ncbi:MAG: hypothetical protein PW843_29085 [Azospirillaceae bacterium]|nr:hypothetical protein [Azospirillaceae bacterium]
MAPAKTILEITDIAKLGDAALQAGIQPGRRVRVSIEYVDAEEARPATLDRLNKKLDLDPLPDEFAHMSDQEIMDYAARMTDEARAQQPDNHARHHRL